MCNLYASSDKIHMVHGYIFVNKGINMIGIKDTCDHVVTCVMPKLNDRAALCDWVTMVLELDVAFVLLLLLTLCVTE